MRTNMRLILVMKRAGSLYIGLYAGGCNVFHRGVINVAAVASLY